MLGMKVEGAPNISAGPRSFHYAYLAGNKGKESAKRCMRIAEKFMIETAIAQNLPLLNKKLTVIKTRILVFEGDKSYRGIYEEQNPVIV